MLQEVSNDNFAGVLHHEQSCKEQQPTKKNDTTMKKDQLRLRPLTILQESHVVAAQSFDKLLRHVHLPQRQLVVVPIVQDVEQVGVKRVDVLREIDNNVAASVKTKYSRGYDNKCSRSSYTSSVANQEDFDRASIRGPVGHYSLQILQVRLASAAEGKINCR